jgi:hypothetical protein
MRHFIPLKTQPPAKMPLVICPYRYQISARGTARTNLMRILAPLAWITAGLAAALIAGRFILTTTPLSSEGFAARYATALPAPTAPKPTYHLGHSLVGRDMPAMLAQLAGAPYASQLGWGASLKNHWQTQVPGLVEENRPPAFRPAFEAIDSGDYAALILTEMVELRDAIRWHDSATYLGKWAARAHKANPATRIYLYETWHRLDDPQGWLTRIDTDLAGLWEGALLRPAMAKPDAPTIYVIPGGQVMAAATRAIEAGEIPGLTRRSELFARLPDGSPDPIHLNDIGNYLVALTHYAVLYHRSPEGLPHQLFRADGSPALASTPKAALALQQLVWRVVTRYPATGVAQE